MASMGAQDFVHLSAAFAAALLLGFAISWLLDGLLLKFFVQDRVAGIALSSAIAFVLLMGMTTALLTMSVPVEHPPIVIPPLGYALCFIVGVAIAGAVRMRLYAREYERNDDQAVFEVDYNDQSLYDEEVLAWDEKHGRKNYLHRHWVGHLSLPVSYWVNGAVFSAILIACTEYLTSKIKAEWGSLQGIAAVLFGYLLLSTLLWAWSSVGIWRSAYWHRRRGGSPFWGVAARTLVLLTAVATIFSSQNIALQAAEYGKLAMGRDSIGGVAEMSISPDGSRLIVKGNLPEGASAKFIALLNASPKVREVVLTSPGGRMFEAERMAELVRKRRLDTRVDGYCMSACVSVLLAGKERGAPNRARIGFHQPSFPGLTGVGLAAAIEKTRNDYIAAGVDPMFVYRALQTPASSIWVPTTDELERANVLTYSEIVVRGHGGHSSGPESESDKSLEADLMGEAARINAAAPIRLDGATTLDRASASHFTLTAYYTVRLPHLDARAKPLVTEMMRASDCANRNTAEILADGGSFVHSYRNAAGKHLFDVRIAGCRS